MVSAEIIISWILRTGVLAGAGLMIAGLIFGPALIWAGVLVLSLTPFVRVLIAGVCFLVQKDLTYFLIALYVIMVLVISSLMKI